MSGLSNNNKSYLDYILYDKYLVSPLMANRGMIIKQLLNYKPTKNPILEQTITFPRDNFLKALKKTNIYNISIFPSCSDTDILRRLSCNQWLNIINKISALNKKIFIILPSIEDIQYQEFLSLSQKLNKINLLITNYDEFISSIKTADLVITIDSQALHIAQQFNKLTIALYGPTNPFGVNLGGKTYPISKSFFCSPCTHKYLKLPCNNEANCMDFTNADLKIFNSIR